ncbi:serine/threonine protein kinase [Streptomyces sp. SHP22-7]|nr:serine/threonine protein kinase [Streptomyces sp. SHP22-7]
MINQLDADSHTDLTADGPYEPPPPLSGTPAAIGEVLSDRWAVVEIRRGGQAWVLIVDDLERGGRRAIKIPLSGALVGDDELEMLLRLEPHRHTVTTLGVTEVRGQPGIVFDYAPSTLTDLIRLGPGLSLAGILQQVCAGMAHLSHIVEVAHLDLKPSNVLIDENGHAKVADFGLAQRVRIQDGRFAGARGGTWAYAAPEVLRREPCDTRADIFSFGVLLYEACTGKLPYPFALAPDPVAQRAQLLDYYASPGPGDRQSELYYWGQSELTQVPVPRPARASASFCRAACSSTCRSARSRSPWSPRCWPERSGDRRSKPRRLPCPGSTSSAGHCRWPKCLSGSTGSTRPSAGSTGCWRRPCPRLSSRPYGRRRCRR